MEKKDKLNPNQDQSEVIDRAIQAMRACEPNTLAAALAMLPDYMEQGASVVLSAAARIIAERFQDTQAALEGFSKIVQKQSDIINNSVSEPVKQ